MPYPAEIELPEHTHGDRWPITSDGAGGLGFGPIQQDIGGGVLADMDAPLARFVFTFRKSGASTSKPFIIDSDASKNPNAPGIIIDADSWEFQIPVMTNFLPSAGDWEFDCAAYIVGVAGPMTIYRGTLTVTPDV